MVVVAAVAGLATRWVGVGRTPEARLVLDPAPSRQLRHWRRGPAPALSPDGKLIAFSAPDRSGTSVLWVRSFSSPHPRALPGTERALLPFWSPDGESLAFFTDGRLKRVDLAGGSPQTIAEAPEPRGATWSPTGDIVFFPTTGAPLHRVAATGGSVTRVTSLSAERQELRHAFPHFLPDGRRFLFFVHSLDDRYTGLYVASLDSGEPTFIAPLQSRAEYADGHLIFGRGRDLLAQRFDLESLELTGEPSRIAEGVGAAFGNLQNYAFTTAAGGSVAYGPAAWSERVDWSFWTPPATSFATSATRITGTACRSRRTGRVSRSSAMTTRRRASTSGSWIWRRRGCRVTRLRGTVSLVWRSRVVSRRRPRPGHELHGAVLGEIDAAIRRHRCAVATRAGRPRWMADRLVTGRPVRRRQPGRPTTRIDIWLVPTGPEEEPIAYARTPFEEHGGRVSPDGKWLLYTSNESGHKEVYVTRFPAERQEGCFELWGRLRPLAR